MIIYTSYLSKLFDNNIINGDLYEHLVIGNDFSTKSKVKVGDMTSQSNSQSSQSNLTNTNTTTNTDNSVQSHNQTSSNTNINSSQAITQTNNINQSSVMDITSSTDTFNYDQSQTTNQTTSNIENKMIQSCGASIEEAQAAINITKDESINTNINNGNIFINTGDNATISDIRLESELGFLSGDVDKSCMLDAMNELTSEVSAENTNSKSFAGGEGGEISAEVGGNSAANDNVASKDDEVSADTEVENELVQEATTETTTTTTNETSSEITTSQSTSQSQSVSSGSGSGSGRGFGSRIFYFVGGLIFIIFIFIVIKKATNSPDDEINRMTAMNYY